MWGNMFAIKMIFVCSCVHLFHFALNLLFKFLRFFPRFCFHKRKIKSYMCAKLKRKIMFMSFFVYCAWLCEHCWVADRLNVFLFFRKSVVHILKKRAAREPIWHNQDRKQDSSAIFSMFEHNYGDAKHLNEIFTRCCVQNRKH